MGTLEDHLNSVTIYASHTHTVLQQSLVLPEEWPRLVASWSLSPCSLSPWPLSLELTRSASWNAELQPQTVHNHFYPKEVKNPLGLSAIFPKPSYHLKHLHSSESLRQNEIKAVNRGTERVYIRQAHWMQPTECIYAVIYIYLLTRLGLSTR